VTGGSSSQQPWMVVGRRRFVWVEARHRVGAWGSGRPPVAFRVALLRNNNVVGWPLPPRTRIKRVGHTKAPDRSSEVVDKKQTEALPGLCLFNSNSTLPCS
jgi:hypothetical protein